MSINIIFSSEHSKIFTSDQQLLLLMTCKGKNMIIKVSDNIKYDKINYYVAKSSLYLNNFLLNLKLVFLK